MIPRTLPFPLPLHVGIDVCHITRIHAILASPRGPRFIRRVLAAEELARPRESVAKLLKQDATRSGGSPVSKWPAERGNLGPNSPLWEAAAFMAGRFAAKEAVIKAHPHRSLTFHDILIQKAQASKGQHLGSGPPSAIIKGVHERVADQEARISISHDGEYATAVCMGFEPGSTQE
ncbi:hypothetical protein GQ53DRAFT_697131 [Thozetella sp. PMI_491]|nr:hypothetical protein GQ53DRAFT_697131 [Thozetella sp. PMI_491]